MSYLTKTYVEDVQWVLYYSYKGVVSGVWYSTSYHYSPRISGWHCLRLSVELALMCYRLFIRDSGPI